VHHPVLALGFGQQRVAIVDVAGENPAAAGSAESLLA
jgi:hypothetical protein